MADMTTGPATIDEAISAAITESGIDMGGAPEVTPDVPVDTPEVEEDAPTDETPEVPEEGTTDAASAKDEDTITVTDDKGTRQVKVDYKDKAKIKRAYEQAAGVQKLYSRFKEVKEELKSLKAGNPETQEVVNNYKKLEELYGDGSYEGQKKLMTQLTRGNLVDFAKQVLAEQEAISRMTPAERKAAELQQEGSKWKTEADTLKAEMAKIRTEAAVQRSQAALESVWPEFSFRGKLGDGVRENKLDEFLFRGVQSRLAEVEEQGYSITPDLIRTTIKDVASVIPDAIQQEARRLASTNKKGVAAQAKKAAQKATIASSARAATKSGDEDEVDWGNLSQTSKWMEQQLARK